MQPIRRILVAVKDPRGKPSAAVIKAVQLAQALGASVVRCSNGGVQGSRPNPLSRRVA